MKKILFVLTCLMASVAMMASVTVTGYQGCYLRTWV